MGEAQGASHPLSADVIGGLRVADAVLGPGGADYLVYFGSFRKARKALMRDHMMPEGGCLTCGLAVGECDLGNLFRDRINGQRVHFGGVILRIADVLPLTIFVDFKT